MRKVRAWFRAWWLALGTAQAAMRNNADYDRCSSVRKLELTYMLLIVLFNAFYAAEVKRHE